MKLHANAALSLKGRQQLCRRVLAEGWTVTEAAAPTFASLAVASRRVRPTPGVVSSGPQSSSSSSARATASASSPRATLSWSTVVAPSHARHTPAGYRTETMGLIVALIVDQHLVGDGFDDEPLGPRSRLMRGRRRVLSVQPCT
jgi:hypothetical protein